MIEMITVIIITAIIAASVAVFLQVPVKSYQDSQRRAQIADAADTAFRRLIRDLQTALPNSVRLTNVGGVFYLEFLQTRTGGRYRAAHASPAETAVCPTAGTGDGDVMRFGAADTCFRSLGAIPDPEPPATTIVPGTDYVVIYNLGPGFTNANAYATGAANGGNKSRITAFSTATNNENQITFGSNTFTLDSPGHRFQVVSGPITYACNPTAGTLIRYSGYAIAAAQPTPPGGTAARIAQGLTTCTITYDQNTNQRTGIVSIWLGFAAAGGAGAINLFTQAQVSNVP